jgi:serine protease Do
VPDGHWIKTTLPAGILALLLGAAATAQTKLDPLQYSLGDLAVKGPWIYNDVTAGFARARKTGKPLLVVFRCVP